MQSHRRIIALDIDGDVEGIRFTDRTIPPQDLPEELMEPTYKAIRLLERCELGASHSPA
ncbi:MAG: hypothetical protein CM1200mP18_06910 [Gammaproteobacteria bacterium]|nr:MAG: hypothetical protein CM1200mP18_06910 [Gammaproteobacteria bacterium]